MNRSRRTESLAAAALWLVACGGPAPTPPVEPAPEPVSAIAVATAPNALANSSAKVPISDGNRIGSATMRQYCMVEAPRIEAASFHSRFSPSSAGVMIRIISGIWKNR